MSNIFACENLVNATIADCYKTHNFIDELFNKASNLEEEAKQEDVYFAQLQSDQFKAFTFPGSQALRVRQQLIDLVFRSQQDMSLVVLKLLDIVIKECGVYHFIKENFRLDCKITRTSDDEKKFNTKQRLMLGVSSVMRYKSLSDYPEILYRTIDASKTHDEQL